MEIIQSLKQKGSNMIKFSAEKNDIFDALITTAKAASAKSVITALEGIHLNLSGNMLTVTGYDLELGIKSTIQVMNKRLHKNVLD